MKVDLTVIVPVYNCECYLDECISSILKQTFTQFELIIVDDGSTDRSFEICTDYAKKDRRIKALHQENSGVLSAKYLGLRHASADYVMFVDSDDWIMPEMCERLYCLMKKYDVEMVASGIIRAFPNGKYKYDYNSLQAGVYRDNDYTQKIIPHMLCNGYFFQWGIDPSMAIKLFRKEVILPLVARAAEYKFYYGEDTAVVYPYMLQINSLYIADECFYFHRQYDDRAGFYVGDSCYVEKLERLYAYLKGLFIKHEQNSILIKQLDYFFAYSMWSKCSYEVYKVVADFQKLNEREYIVPFDCIPRGARLVLYGAGNVGKVFYAQLKQTEYCREIEWCDKQYKSLQEKGLPVGNPEEMKEADIYLIAVANKALAEEIKKGFVKRGIEERKITWKDPLLRMW